MYLCCDLGLVFLGVVMSLGEMCWCRYTTGLPTSGLSPKCLRGRITRDARAERRAFAAPPPPRHVVIREITGGGFGTTN